MTNNDQTPDFFPASTASSAPDFIPHTDPDFFPANAKSSQSVPNGTISARPTGLTSWFEDLQSDIRHGSGTTAPGRLLRFMGAPGTSEGEPESVGEFMGGPVIGPVKVATGLARAGRASTSQDVAGHRGTELLRGANEVVTGVLQTPGPFTGAVLGPEGLAALPLYGVGAHVAQRGLEASGMSPDASELSANLLTLLAGGALAKRNIAANRSAGKVVRGPLQDQSIPGGEAGGTQLNASGESSASLEAINRVASEGSQGIKRVRIDTRSGQETPLFGPDAVDARAGSFDRIVQRYADGREVTLDEGPRARPSSGMASGTSAFPLVGREIPGESSPNVYDLGEINDNPVAKLYGASPVGQAEPPDFIPLRQPSLIQRGFEKWADVRAHDPEIADSLQQLDNAPNYFRAKAQNAVTNVLGDGESRLLPPQERLFTLIADADSRENLQTNHPEEFQTALNDPAIRSALERYKPIEQQLTSAREQLGGKTLDGDYLARVYEDYTGERLPGTGSRRIGIQSETAPSAPERTASSEYFYENGTHELEPSLVPKYVGTNLRLARELLVNKFTEKATKLESGQELPESITYNNREYQKPDVTPNGKRLPTDYSVYDTADGRYLGPKTVVDALRNYDPLSNRTGGKVGPIRSWMQKQILMGGAGVPHAFNILRRVASEAPLGVADPRGWIDAARVTFGKELRARGLRGLNDPTFDSLVKNGALSANEMTALKKYWGGNLNPANWAEAALRPGKKLLFEPGTLGGLGGLDQRARVWLADRIRSERPSLSDAAIAREVNTTLGSYSRSNWTEFQKKLGYFLLFPGWDTSSMHYTLTHPVKSTVPAAMLNLIANQTLARLGKQRDPEDATDPFSIHIGEHSISSSLTREAMAIHLARPLWTAAIEAYHGRPAVEAGGKQAFREALHMTRPDLSGLLALGSSAAGLNLPGATIYNRSDVLTPGKILPNRALEKVAAYTVLRANPMADRLLSGDTQHLEEKLRTYQAALGGDREAFKTITQDFGRTTLSSLGVYDYRRDAEQRLLSRERTSRLINYTLQKMALKNPDAAQNFITTDSQNAAYVMFHNDFASMTRGLKQLNDAYDAAKTDSERTQIENYRKALLANSELLNDAFMKVEVQPPTRPSMRRK